MPLLLRRSDDDPTGKLSRGNPFPRKEFTVPKEEESKALDEIDGNAFGKTRRDLFLLAQEAVEVLAQNLRSDDTAAQVAAADAVLRQVFAPMSAYSFKGHLSNQGPNTLVLEKVSGAKEGPPERIGPGGSGHWYGTYDGFNYTGEVCYKAEGTSYKVKCTWEIPLFGNNTIKSETDIPGCTALHEGGRGWHAEVWYYLECG